MSIVGTNCNEICAKLREMGFRNEGERPISENMLEKAMLFKLWSPENEKRYRGADGHLVRFNFLRIVEGGYQLTGEDLK